MGMNFEILIENNGFLTVSNFFNQKMNIKEIKVKAVLTKSGLPDAEWAVNPYVGCAFGCKYCYAAFIGRWKHPGEEWGEFVDVKINAPEVLKIELEKMGKKLKSKNFGSIFFSSVTDSYQGVEAKYQITRQCLQVLADFGYEGEISILTKSPLVCRDIDIFKKLKNASIGLTITSLDDSVSRFLEGNAPSVSSRIGALKELHNADIPIYAFVGPLLPYFTARADKLENLFTELKNSGAAEVYIEHINLSPKIRERLVFKGGQTCYLIEAEKNIGIPDAARIKFYAARLYDNIYQCMMELSEDAYVKREENKLRPACVTKRAIVQGCITREAALCDKGCHLIDIVLANIQKIRS
jgi:DNA repair photolyase